MSTKDIARLFKVSSRAIQLWSKDLGCPRDGHGQWDLEKVLPWWLENIYSGDDDDEGIKQAKLMHWRAKARIAVVKADEAEGKVASIDEFVKAWVWRVSEVSNGLGSLPMRLAPLIEMKPELEIRQVLDAEIWKIRDKFSRTGKFTNISKPKKTIAEKPDVNPEKPRAARAKKTKVKD